MKNAEIRNAAQAAGVRLWRIAQELGMNDGNFSRKLRVELPEAEREKILRIIAELSVEVES